MKLLQTKAACMALAALALAACQPAVDDSGRPVLAAEDTPQDHTIRMVEDDMVAIWKSPQTGCEYLLYGARGGITPNLDRAGNIICSADLP